MAYTIYINPVLINGNENIKNVLKNLPSLQIIKTMSVRILMK